MRIGVPAEVKNNEFRVAMTPAGAHALVQRGHRVDIQAGAGEGAGYHDDEYRAVGANIVATSAFQKPHPVTSKVPSTGSYPTEKPARSSPTRSIQSHVCAVEPARYEPEKKIFLEARRVPK